MKKNKKNIWEFPWGYTESFSVMGGILITGFLLQFFSGNVDIEMLHASANLIIGIIIFFIPVVFTIFRKKPIYHWFSGIPFSVTVIATLLILSLIMGLIPQQTGSADLYSDFSFRMGFTRISSSWPFVLVYLICLLSLETIIIKRFLSFRIKDYPFYLIHLGIWLLLFTAGLGAADMRSYVMYVREGETEWRVYNEKGQVLELPIAIELNDFDMELYPPKLAAIDRETGDIQPIGKPDFYQIDEQNPKGNLAGWEIAIEKYIHHAVRNSDSTYREVHMPGASPAVKISARNQQNNIVKTGWVCAGNSAQLYMTLPLNDQYTIVMTQPEPKRFLSDVFVYTKEGEKKHSIIEVNNPLRLGSWTIYQYGYDAEAGRLSSYSSFQLIYDPWLPGVYIGIILLAAGALCMLWSGNKKRRNEYEME
ncbi:MAG: cytochrome c biogenesis protein ResB [Candidatus Azobacteroides sp.]|nr:cytochrome c biogenesis protein ResB [Candidatus Azobacteroides sp.]